MDANDYRDALAKLGWRQADLCRRLKITPTTSSRWAHDGPPHWAAEYLNTLIALDEMHRRFVAPQKPAA